LTFRQNPCQRAEIILSLKNFIDDATDQNKLQSIFSLIGFEKIKTNYKAEIVRQN
jgi:hypothetical protein